jgi:Protein of unknown function (DUF4232)
MWHVIAVLAFAGTAALAVTLTRVPERPEHAALSSSLALSPCPTSVLDAWVGLGATESTSIPHDGHHLEGDITYYTLEFTNVSARTCSLYGYPEVSAYAGSAVTGTQIGSAASYDPAVRPRPVTLAPGATAHSVLRVTGPGQFQPAACARVTAPELRVLLPDQGVRIQPAFVPITLPACSKPGPEFLSVQAIQPRPGIPGFALP